MTGLVQLGTAHERKQARFRNRPRHDAARAPPAPPTGTVPPINKSPLNAAGGSSATERCAHPARRRSARARRSGRPQRIGPRRRRLGGGESRLPIRCTVTPPLADGVSCARPPHASGAATPSPAVHWSHPLITDTPTCGWGWPPSPALSNAALVFVPCRVPVLIPTGRSRGFAAGFQAVSIATTGLAGCVAGGGGGLCSHPRPPHLYFWSATTSRRGRASGAGALSGPPCRSEW